jgi:Xaa-Pro aminopeptidase
MKKYILCNTYFDNSLIILINNDRTVKSKEEIYNINHITNKTGLSIIHIMKNIDKFNTEKDIQNEIEKYMIGYEIAFPLICASKRNSSIIHYIDNKDNLDGLLLMDIGFKYKNLCCDIARTIPINKKFNNKQKILYNMILNLSNYSINNIKIGINMNDLEMKMRKLYLKFLLYFKFINYPNIKLTYLFMPHLLGHSVGIDVHDIDFDYFKNNIVFTIEPGIYFTEEILNNKYVNKEEVLKYYDIGGIRIEDMLTIYNNKIILLSNNVPREIEAIENIMIKY